MKRVIERCRSVFATAAVLLAGIFSTAAHAADTAPAGVTLVDLTTPSTTCSYECSKTPNKFLPFNDSTSLTDANYRVLANTTSITVICDFGEDNAQIVNAYKVYMFSNGCNNRTPSAWTLSGSNDNTNWVPIDSRSGENSWANLESRFFYANNTKKYRYYKQAFTATSGATDYIQFGRLEYFSLFNFAVESPQLVDCGDGTWRLTGMLNDVGEGEVSLVFSTPGVEDVSVSLGELSSKAAIDAVIDLSETAVSGTALYEVKVVVPDDNDGCATVLPGMFYFGEYATEPEEFRYKLPIALDSAIATSVGTASYSDFPVLVRLSKEIAGFDYAALAVSLRGHDLLFTDETGTRLNFEVETWNTQGESLVWVKVPTLSASTAITCYYGSDKVAVEALEPEKTWSRYVGVWHFAPSEAGGMTAADATGHGLDGTAGKAFTTYAGPFGGDALRSAGSVKAPDYEKSQNVSSVFTASGWFKGPDFAGTKGSYASFVSKKVGLNWDDAKGWYIQMNQAKTNAGCVLTSSETIATIPDVTKNWNYYTIVSDGSTVKVYYNGSDKASVTKTYTVKTSGTEYVIGAVNFCEDEYRIRKTAASAAETKLEYQTMAKLDFLSFGTIESMDETAPVIAPPTIVRNADGSFTVTTEVTGNAPKAGSAKCVIGSNEYPMTGSGLGTYTATVSGLAEGTYLCSVKMLSTAGTECMRAAERALYAGELAITFGQDANEDGLVTGYFTVTRGDTANDLTVEFTVDESSTAIADQTYVALQSPVVIPEGATSVRIEVTPKMDAETQADTTVKVNLAEGPYGISPTQASAQLTVVNLTTPAGWNTWVAPADGLASVASNWSNGVPQAGDKILFDGRFSTANCEWDAGVNGLTAQLGAWKQTVDYAGTITFDTTYTGTFTELAVSGDALVEGGVWTHNRGAANVSTPTYRLKVKVGGVFTLGANASVDLKGKGFAGGQKPSGSTAGSHAASGDGYAKIYGNVYAPELPGSGSNGANNWGGGAFWLEASGAVTLDGTISVRCNEADNINQPSCGSVYIKAASCTGAGYIYANYAASSGYNGKGLGSGGRVAIVLTEANELGFAESHVGIQGIVCGAMGGGGGTFFYKTANQPNGTLVLDDWRYKDYARHWRLPKSITAIPAGETWTFDAIKIRNYGMLAIPEGTTLNLPNGPQSVTATATRQGGLLYQGGTLDFGSAPYVFSSGWIFQANAPYTFDGDVQIAANGNIGCMMYQGATDFSNATKCDITVNGNLTIDADGAVYAVAGGPDMPINRNSYAYHGGSTVNATAMPLVYDSIFNPVYPGYTAADGDTATTRPGGGAVKLTVMGDLVVNGTITADGYLGGDIGASGAGGSVNITAKTLSGDGKITAGATTENRWTFFNVGGAGRVSVRLTDGTFTEAWKSRITARGRAMWDTKSSPNVDHGASAGTVYLQEKGQGEKAGEIRIINDNATTPTTAYTLFPATSTVKAPTDEISDFRAASLMIDGKAIVKISDAVRLKTLTVASDSSLDLNGKVLTVARAVVNGAKLQPGTYTKDSAAVSGYVTGEGSLVITGGGIAVIVR